MENASSTNFCSIVSCEDCKGFYLQYRYVRIHVDNSGLFDTLKVVYEYENYDEEFKDANPLTLKYGLAVLSIIPQDFKLFKNVVENAALEMIEIPSIEKYN